MDKLQTPIRKIHIEPQSGAGFTMERGQTLRIIDVQGEQVADMFCFAQNDLHERLSSGHTTDYNENIFLSTGDILYSSHSNPMVTITADRVGRHIILYAPCSQKMYEMSYGIEEPHPNCMDNLVDNLEEYGISESDITIPFNIFMHVEISDQGKISILTPGSKAGDFIDLKAEMDLIVGVTACSAGICNNFKWTPIDIEIY